MKMRLHFGILVITLVALLGSIECTSDRDAEEFLRGFSDEEDFGPPRQRQQPEPFPEHWIHYPYPYYYDENGVIRDFMKLGSEGLIFRGLLVGMIRRDGRREYLSRNNSQYVIRLQDGEVLYRTRGQPRIPSAATPSSLNPNRSYIRHIRRH